MLETYYLETVIKILSHLSLKNISVCGCVKIQEHISQCIKNGDDKDIAYIRTLSQSYFADNVALYFKLIEEKHSETYVSLLSSAIKYTKRPWMNKRS